VYRYQVDDRKPYIFRTTDYGKTWTKIVTGISDGHFVRAVREDHVRKGLLFAGTEHGVYVSFNAGDNWQPLQLNLPDTPIRDLVVKDNDVVLGTHGRGFWVLDDIQPLREVTAEAEKQKVHFFKPGDVYRGLTAASFQYFLENQADSVKIEIIDSNGKLVDSFTGTQTSYKPDPKVEWWDQKPFPPTTAKGLNQFTWWPAYRGATVFDGMILWSADSKRGPIAPTGVYRIRLTTGGVMQEQPLQVKINPNLKGVTEADLKETFELAIKIRDNESRNNEAVIRIRKLRDRINLSTVGVNDAALISASQDLLSKITVIEEALYQTKNRSGQDPLNFPIRLGNRLAALRRSLETGDARPTAGAYQVHQELNAELDGHLSKLNLAVSSGLSTLNKRLAALNISEIKE
jgi:hypothetical protein